MRLLFTIDKQDYEDCTRTYVRNSARSIIIRDGKVAMIHSLKYDYYKFPGGGIEQGEDPVEAVIRETREEAGLIVVPDSIKEYGYVHRVQKSDSDPSERFVQDNYYYLCAVENRLVPLDLDPYEEEAAYQLEFVDPALVIYKNRLEPTHVMREREARVLEGLIAEGVYQK